MRDADPNNPLPSGERENAWHLRRRPWESPRCSRQVAVRATPVYDSVMTPGALLTDGNRYVGRKAWRLLPHDRTAIESLARTLQISPILAQLLVNRNLGDPDVARRFLAAPLSGMHEPELLPGVVEAVDRLFAAIEGRRRICIYGDYDVDGVSGSAILLTCLKHLGADVDFHVPHRLDEGYGLNNEALAKIAADGFSTVVTVDCGIASVDEAEEARRLGLELIVTDHHEPKATLPNAAVLVHPRIPGPNGAPYPFGWICGAGVAFKLAWALCKRKCGSAKVTPILREFLLDAICLAALGTVADVVPLNDENRILVRHGLHRLRTAPTLGLKTLVRFARLDGKSNFTAFDIGFGLAPRINAAGRLGTARLAVELLTTQAPQRAEVLADYLERQNQERQNLERRILQEAREQAESELQNPALILANPNWHPGLLGIVASRLVDLFARPVLMIALREGQHGQGSGRSVPGFRLHEALQECTSMLLSHGGHAAAAGFRIGPERIEEFRPRFFECVEKALGTEPRQHSLTIDAEIPLASLTTSLLQSFADLEPFGSGNPQPVLLSSNLQVAGEPKRLGGGERHLSFRVRQHGKELRAIAFGMGERADELMSNGGACSLVFTPRINEYQGYRSVELDVKDFQPSPDALLS